MPWRVEKHPCCDRPGYAPQRLEFTLACDDEPMQTEPLGLYRTRDWFRRYNERARIVTENENRRILQWWSR
jgi:hypothetical protein